MSRTIIARTTRVYLFLVGLGLSALGSASPALAQSGTPEARSGDGVFRVKEIHDRYFLFIIPTHICQVTVEPSNLPPHDYDVRFEILAIDRGEKLLFKDELVAVKGEKRYLVFRFPYDCDQIAKIRFRNFRCMRTVSNSRVGVPCKARYFGQTFENKLPK